MIRYSMVCDVCGDEKPISSASLHPPGWSKMKISVHGFGQFSGHNDIERSKDMCPRCQGKLYSKLDEETWDEN